MPILAYILYIHTLYSNRIYLPTSTSPVTASLLMYFCLPSLSPQLHTTWAACANLVTFFILERDFSRLPCVWWPAQSLFTLPSLKAVGTGVAGGENKVLWAAVSSKGECVHGMWSAQEWEESPWKGRTDIQTWSIPNDAQHKCNEGRLWHLACFLYALLNLNYAFELFGKSLKWNCLTQSGCPEESLPACGILSVLGVNYTNWITNVHFRQIK